MTRTLRSAMLLVGLTLLCFVHAEAAELTLSAPEALEQAEAGKILLVDIRTPPEWRQTGIAAEAQAIDMSSPEFLDTLLEAVAGDRSAPIALICRTGNRSGAVQRALRQYGFTQVYDIPEGMVGSRAGPGWLKRGLPVEQCTRC